LTAWCEHLGAAARVMDAESAVPLEQRCREIYEMAKIAITPGWVRCYLIGAS
jgi:hypothetical protein